MTRAPTIGTIFGIEVRPHWTWLLLPPCVLAYGAITGPWRVALVNLTILAALYACVLVHELAHAVVARRFGIGTRDITLYPFWGVGRLTRLSERPWQENYIALAGPFVHATVAAVVGAGLVFSGHAVTPLAVIVEPAANHFLVGLFWANVLLAGMNALPGLPLDGGRIFRASLALTTSRLRATEVAAALSTVLAALFIMATIWLKSPLLGVAAVTLYLSAQEDLGLTRYFAALRTAADDRPDDGPAAIVPLDRVVDAGGRPTEPNFTGFTWSASARLWIEWRDGEPVGANALIGD